MEVGASNYKLASYSELNKWIGTGPSLAINRCKLQVLIDANYNFFLCYRVMCIFLLRSSQTVEVTDSATTDQCELGCSKSISISKRLLTNTLSKRISAGRAQKEDPHTGK